MKQSASVISGRHTDPQLRQHDPVGTHEGRHGDSCPDQTPPTVAQPVSEVSEQLPSQRQQPPKTSKVVVIRTLNSPKTGYWENSILPGAVYSATERANTSSGQVGSMTTSSPSLWKVPPNVQLSSGGRQSPGQHPMLLSSAMMLKIAFKETDAGNYLEKTINEILNEGYRTSDLMSNECNKQVSCSQMGELLAEKIK